MIEILRPTPHKIEVLHDISPKCWVNAFLPTADELALLQRRFHVPRDILEALSDPDEISSVEEKKEFTFFVIRAPYNNERIPLQYTTVPIGIFVTSSMVITISLFDNKAISELKKLRFEFRKTHVVFHLLFSCARMYLHYLQDIRHKMYGIESKLEKTLDNKLVMKLLELEKDLVYFDTSLKSNSILIERLIREGTSNRFVHIKTLDDRKLIENVLDETRQAIEMSNIYSNILSNTLDAFASIISNNLNNVIKVLTSITIVFTIPILISSVYGMNMELPFQHAPHAFLIVMGFAFLISLSCIFFLRRSRLL